ncbi:serine acetyltransferase [Rhodococcus fascians]|jgi:serine O-acetyltransferase|uniref:hypothetical protein n=1 Tax=Nocardiaceae TaxID=85025 RepID=UPI0009B92A70|nr:MULTISPECIES: hypothetical protein [Rhodococcus]MBY3791307.1 serine acetyltransferase [Rhodococcus fascians]MBY3824003.1 serine acetyltransferase [Rhodococcus fascians]MBY3834525.1 serine acetyltransferase [Rhodococcus fascians]MBY3863737.1 serine acetyltransferase [Rhodococcus fascians]MBY3883208.1 serine acetyltransferase [Rhodococcus fascians]
MDPAALWFLSCKLHHRGWRVGAKLIKMVNFLVFHAVLPVECELKSKVTLWHRGLGTVIHPNSTIGSGVVIGHGVTFGASSNVAGSPLRVIIEDNVTIGAHAYIAGSRGRAIVIGEGSIIGAHAVVTEDVQSGARMVGPKAVDIASRRA